MENPPAEELIWEDDPDSVLCVVCCLDNAQCYSCHEWNALLNADTVPINADPKDFQYTYSIICNIISEPLAQKIKIILMDYSNGMRFPDIGLLCNVAEGRL